MHEPARRRRTMRAAARVGLGASGAAPGHSGQRDRVRPALPGRFAQGDDVGGFPRPAPQRQARSRRPRSAPAHRPRREPRGAATALGFEPGAQDRLELEAGRVERSWSHGGGERAVVPAPAVMTDPVPVLGTRRRRRLPAGTLSPSGLARLRADPRVAERVRAAPPDRTSCPARPGWCCTPCSSPRVGRASSGSGCSSPRGHGCRAAWCGWCSARCSCPRSRRRVGRPQPRDPPAQERERRAVPAPRHGSKPPRLERAPGAGGLGVAGDEPGGHDPDRCGRLQAIPRRRPVEATARRLDRASAAAGP